MESSAHAAARRLLAACLLVGRPGRDLAGLAAADLDWTALLAIAEAQFIGPQVWQALLDEEATGPVPAAAQATLREVYLGATAANALLLHDLARIQALLEQVGIPSVALKGAALVAAHYPAIGARLIGDIDLLVRPSDLMEASTALRRAGLRHPDELMPLLDGSTIAGVARDPGGDHLPRLATWSGVPLEVHDRVPGGGPSPEAILARARTVHWQGRPLVIPAPSDLAGMACLHDLLKHRADAMFRARHVADLHALMRVEPIDWEEVRARYGAGEGAWALEESRALLEAARREAAGEGRADPRLAFLEPRPTGRALTERLQGYLKSIRVARGEGGRGPAARLFFPARRYMESRYHLRPGSPLVWPLYPWRILRAVLGLVWPERKG